MKRSSKSFSVEIKKSRVQGQRRSLPPRILFEPVPAESQKVLQTQEQHAVVQPMAAPRILPSIVKPMWSDAEPVGRRQSSRPKAGQSQMGVDLDEGAPEDAAKETLVIPEAQSQADAAAATGEAATPVHKVQAQGIESAKAKSRQPRKKASEMFEAAMPSEPVSQPEQASEAEIIKSLRTEGRLTAGDRRQAERQAAAAQLPRHERWKRRVPPAAW